VEQYRYFRRAFDVRIADVAEETFDRLENFRFVLLLVDDLAYIVVTVQLRFVGETAITSVAAEILLVLQQLMLGVGTRRFEAFAAYFAHITCTLHVDEHVV